MFRAVKVLKQIGQSIERLYISYCFSFLKLEYGNKLFHPSSLTSATFLFPIDKSLISGGGGRINGHLLRPSERKQNILILMCKNLGQALQHKRLRTFLGGQPFSPLRGCSKCLFRLSFYEYHSVGQIQSSINPNLKRKFPIEISTTEETKRNTLRRERN